MLTNLLDNAIRHTPEGKRIMLSAAEAVLDDQRWIKLVVADEGHGISEQDLPYVFERFYKADKARTREINGGTGLGLAIVKYFIDAHGGQVDTHKQSWRGKRPLRSICRCEPSYTHTKERNPNRITPY